MTRHRIQRLFERGVIGGGGAAVPYSTTLIDTYGASEVWPLVDIASGTTITAKVASARNGSLTGWDLQNAAGPVTGTLAPYADGANDYGNIFTANLAGIFNGTAGSVFIWSKVESGAVLTDSTARQLFILYSGASNYLQFGRTTTNNQYAFLRRAGGTTKTLNATATATGWVSWGVSWNEAGNELRVCLNGVSQATDVSSAWTGAIVSGLVGAQGTPAQVWKGWLGYFAVKFGSIWTEANFLAMHNAAATAGVG